jgi:cysteinyl-tRNA synthetase
MHTLFLHNSLTRRKEQFEPLDPQHVRMYVCGATVYDLVHVGNARPEVVYDVLARLLRRLYPRVTYVRNITDVEDKINARAHELGEPISALTARTIADYHADLAMLGSHPPDIEPRATEHIGEMIVMIERLIASGHAYAAEGHVLFAVKRVAGRGAGGRGAVQARPRGLRAVEAVRSGPARLGLAVGPWPARLAHRVQRHVVALPGRDVR